MLETRWFKQPLELQHDWMRFVTRSTIRVLHVLSEFSMGIIVLSLIGTAILLAISLPDRN